MNKINSKMLLIIGIIGILLLLSGCAPAPVAPPNNNPPVQAASLTVYSQCPACWGYVIINGTSTGYYIAQNGAVTITGLAPGTTAAVQIADEFGWWSHTEYVVLQSGNNIVVFDRFF